MALRRPILCRDAGIRTRSLTNPNRECYRYTTSRKRIRQGAWIYFLPSDERCAGTALGPSLTIVRVGLPESFLTGTVYLCGFFKAELFKNNAKLFDSRAGSAQALPSPLLHCVSVGLPGIEPGLHPPHGCVLPVYHSPIQDITGCVLHTKQSSVRA